MSDAFMQQSAASGMTEADWQALIDAKPKQPGTGQNRPAPRQNNPYNIQPPGPTASTNYATGTMNAGYVWLGAGVGWAWQDERGQIDPTVQNAFAVSNAENERRLAQAGSEESSLVYNPDSGTYSARYHPGMVATTGDHPSGWLTEQEIIQAVKDSGLVWGTDQTGSASAQSGNIGSYTQGYGFDEQGNPITRVGYTDNAGNQYVMTADGKVVKDNTARNEARIAGLDAGKKARMDALGQTGPGKGGTSEQRDAFQFLKNFLADFGLGDMSQWAWDQILAGNSNERTLMEMRQTPQYKKRFAGMDIRKQKGLAAMSEAEYIAYERNVRQMMAESGLPPEFFDTPEDFVSLLGNDVSIRELSARVSGLFAAAEAAPIEVRQTFNDYFGVNGTAALATYFLDPTKALPLLQDELRQAEIGGTATRFGIAVGRERAARLADIGTTMDQAAQGFNQLDRMRPLFRESITEAQDLSLEGEGIDAVFGVAGGAADKLAQRGKERTAAFSGGGGAAMSQGGVLGLQSDR